MYRPRHPQDLALTDMPHFLLFTFCLSLCISFPFLFCEEAKDYEGPSDVVSTEGLPSNFVNQTVCVISGEYTDHMQDLVLPGPEPFVLQRFYSNFSREGSFGTGWNFNHYENAVIQDAYHPDDGPLYVVSVRQTSGALLDYKQLNDKKFKKKHKVKFDFIPPKGLTNGAGHLSGQTNVKNQQVYFYPQEKKIVAISGDGNRRSFKETDALLLYSTLNNQLHSKISGAMLSLYTAQQMRKVAR